MKLALFLPKDDSARPFQATAQGKLLVGDLQLLELLAEQEREREEEKDREANPEKSKPT